MREDKIQDGMLFKPYGNFEFDGYQCKIETPNGTISVRCECSTLFIDTERPYEVWYPDDDAPIGYQTANDIFNYIKRMKNTTMQPISFSPGMVQAIFEICQRP